MGNVTAKVRCTGKYITGSGDSRQVKVDFVPDYNDGRNKEWARYTPSLQLSMTLRGEVADRFELDKDYVLTFAEDVPEPEPLPMAEPVAELPRDEQGRLLDGVPAGFVD